MQEVWRVGDAIEITIATRKFRRLLNSIAFVQLIALRPKANGGAYLGIAIFPVTSPVSVVATLTIPSAPAEKSRLPSKVKARDRQPALWRRVRQAVSTLPWPLVLDASALDSGLESGGSAGKRII